MVDAEAQGMRIVGLGFLRIYCDQLWANKIDGNAIPEIAQISPSRIHANSGGVVGWFVEQAAQAGRICLDFSNSSDIISPVGGNKPFHGTNPLAFACPTREDAAPLAIDMATSQVAYVVVKKRADAGLPIPESWGEVPMVNQLPIHVM